MYISPFEILEWIGKVAYKLNLPTSMDQIHNGFHVSALWKYILDASHVLPDIPMNLETNLIYEVRLVKFLLREVKQVRNKGIPLVNVL